MYPKQDKELLNIVIAGSVDDGKSTLIGRLFYDTKRIYQDQLASIKKSSVKSGTDLDLSLLTDGLASEREQKITIDVAYRYFSTAKRRFNIADVPGHEQYTRNMATGASNADLAIILADAAKGLLTQSRRHLFIASLMGISHILVVVNKMDQVDYSEEVFEKIKDQFTDFTTKLNIDDLQFIPISALAGDMVVGRGGNMDWYQGSTVLSYLENLEISSDRNLIDFRFPVQLVKKIDNSRFYFGQVASGVIEKGEKVIILPSGLVSEVKSIVYDRNSQDNAFSPKSIALTLSDELDVSRGDMIVRQKNTPDVSTEIEAEVVWLAGEDLKSGNSYILKHTTKTTRCHVEDIIYKINIKTLHREPAASIKTNEIGRVFIKTNDLLSFDEYQKNKDAGRFIIIDQASNNTVGAGVILRRARVKPEKKSAVQPANGCTLWFTGLSGSGKSTIAAELAGHLAEKGVSFERLDGDDLRQNLSFDLSFSAQDRDQNIKRAVYLAKMLNSHGIMVLATFISPYENHRRLARNELGNFIEIFVDAPLELCQRRDVKGLYKKAGSGEVKNFTGVSADYQRPKNPEIRLDTEKLTVKECVDQIISYLKEHSLL
ncbi:adenylyl-sulfate kinase [Candidatus Falkowbacteria bacterium]|nr:adenylyl-sulfate kinase [Candidatus Falkowbacteria bacterium]